MPKNETIAQLGLDEYKYDFVTDDEPVFKAVPGLSEEIVRQISAHKEEPQWMLDFRLKALRIYEAKPMPDWGGDLSTCLLYTSPSPRDRTRSRMPSSA